MPTLNWIGKDKVINHHQDVPFRVLARQYAYGSPDSGNMIIKGDNLHALKALLPQYEGRVKCIYIDPPYNTGEENWIYNDRVDNPQFQRWIGEIVGKEGEDLSRHDKWLCMMYPRLRLLQRLLSNDGTIFISIDDNESANLRMICNEIFGQTNFIASFIWEKRLNRENRKIVSSRHDYIFCYSNGQSPERRPINLLPMTKEALGRYVNPDNDPHGSWKSDPAHAQAGHATASQFYVLTAPNGKKHSLPSGRCWVYTQEVMEQEIAANRIWFGRDGNGVPRIKTYLHEKERGLTPETLWFAADVSTNETAKNNLKKLFDGNAAFPTPKPTELIERIVRLATNPDSIILDSFAGSGTTAHAVLNMNKQDGGNRKFILVEMEDYAENITAERVRRVIGGYADVEGTGGGFDFYELGEPLIFANGNLNEAVDTEKIRAYIWYMETRTNYRPQTQTPGHGSADMGTQASRLHAGGTPALPCHAGETSALPCPCQEQYLLGIHADTAYYFHYEKDRVTTLDAAFLAGVTNAERYIIYADRCAVSDDRLKKLGVTFRKIPRDIARL